MSQISIKNEQQIQLMLKQKVVDIDQITERRGFIYNFLQIAQDKMVNLSKNIFGDFGYERKNRYSVDNKHKILEYLKQKSLLISSNLQQQGKKGYYNYDPNFFQKKPKNLAAMKQMLLQGKSQVQAAQGTLQRYKSSRDFIRVKFLNQAAYQFDRQRYCSILWGVITGSLINATLYKKGKTIRKAALFVTLAHLFGQISYHLNLDKYFDSVYVIFQEEAEAFMKEEKKRLKNGQMKFIKNDIQ